MLDWIGARGPIAGSLFLDHGESGASEELRRLSQSRALAPVVAVPEIGERYELLPGAPAKRIRTGRTDVQQALGRDWQNAYADLATSLKRRLEAIRDTEARQKAIDEMRRILDTYGEKRKG